MTAKTYDQMMPRLKPTDLCRAIIAGYGEPTTPPKFMDYIEGCRSHPVQFDRVTNGALGMVMVLFSSVDPATYQAVHTNLNQQRVMENIQIV